jgi:hypothetical protein
MTRIGSLIAKNGVSDNKPGDQRGLSGPQAGGDGIAEAEFIRLAFGPRFKRKLSQHGGSLPVRASRPVRGLYDRPRRNQFRS